MTPEQQKHYCNICGFTTTREAKLEDHMKSVHGYYFDDGETEASFETFVRKPSVSAGNIALKQLVESLEIHQQYVLCWTAKFCFSNLFPPLFKQGFGLNKHYDWNEVGNYSDASSYLQELLQDAFKKGAEYIYLYKRIKIIDEGETLVHFYLRPNMTLPSPNSALFLVEDSDDENLARISLRKRPNEVLVEEPTLAGGNRRIYEEFKIPNLPFNPHTYPVTTSRKGNIILNPELFPAERIHHISGIYILNLF